MNHARNFYVIQDDQYQIKIGVSEDITRRLRQLQTGNPRQLSIYKTYYCQKPYKMETLLKERLSPYRLKGEWFLISELSHDNLNSILSSTYSDYENEFFLMKKSQHCKKYYQKKILEAREKIHIEVELKKKIFDRQYKFYEQQYKYFMRHQNFYDESIKNFLEDDTLNDGEIHNFLIEIATHNKLLCYKWDIDNPE